MGGISSSGGGNKTMSFGKSKARMTAPDDKNKITFEDVAGIEEEKGKNGLFSKFKRNDSQENNPDVIDANIYKNAAKARFYLKQTGILWTLWTIWTKWTKGF